MSAPTSSEFSVLLPAASVAVFSNHDETRQAVAALANDWRFARVRFDIQTGDAHKAMSVYASAPSPNLLIVDTDTIDATFTSLLEKLAATCSAGTDAVVIGPDNDVALYRSLINMGVGDYLVRPLSTATIAQVIGRILMQQLGASESHLIAMIGAKGGVGVSTLAGVLAHGLAEEYQEKTIVLDGAGGRSYLSVAFGFEPLTTCAEAVRAAMSSDQSALDRLLQKAGDHLHVLGTGNDRALDDPASGDQLERLLDRLLAVTPYVVADLSGTSPTIQRAVLARAQRVILVSQPTLSSLRLARTLLHEIKDLKGGSFDALDLVINMVGLAPGAEVGKTDIETAMEHKVAMQCPFDPKLVIGAEAQAKILGTVKGIEKTRHDLLGLLRLSTRQSVGRGGGEPKESFLGTLFRKGKK